jgi:hypothetical protein
VTNNSTSVLEDPWDPGQARQELAARGISASLGAACLPSFTPSTMAKKTIAELEEIFYLQQQLAKQKERLQFLEEHFRSCRTAFPISPPPDRHCNEISIRPTLEQPPVDERGSTTVCTHYEGLAGHSDIPVEQTALTNAEACHPTSPVSLQPDHHHDPVIRASRTALVIDGDVPVKYSLANSEAHSTPSTLKDHASDPNTTANTSGGQVPGTRKRRWEDNASILTTKFKLTNRARVTTSKQPQRELRHEPLDLKSLLGHDALVTSIIHGTTCSMQALSTNSTLHPIAAARRYANMAKDSRVQAKFASLIASFQDLIFHSMCVVLIHCGYSVEDVDTVMRNRSSTSAPKNLQRLRNGAAWANEVISETTEGEWTGISDCIAELYFYREWFYDSSLKAKLIRARRYQDVDVWLSSRLEGRIEIILRSSSKPD